MATELVKAALNSTWTDVAGTASSQLGVHWQNIGGLPIGLAFSTSAPGATDPYITLAPSQTFQDNPGSAHVWAICFGGTSIISATLNPASGGGGGGGGAVTIADGADVAEGAKADAVYAGSGAATLVGINKGIYNLLSIALPAGSAIIGKVGIDQTTPGTTNLVSATQSGAWTISNTTFAASQATASNLNAAVVGNVAAAATDSGSPVKVGGYAMSTAPTAVTNGQRTNAWYGLTGATIVGGTALALTDGFSNTAVAMVRADTGTGAQAGALISVFNGTTWDRSRGDVNGSVNQPHAMTANRWSYAAASGGISNTTTAVTFIAAAGASTRNYVTGIQIFAGALGAATEIAIRDGAAGTVIWRGVISTAGVSAIDINFPVPIKSSVNTLLEVVTLTATITGSVYFNSQGYTGT